MDRPLTTRASLRRTARLLPALAAVLLAVACASTGARPAGRASGAPPAGDATAAAPAAPAQAASEAATPRPVKLRVAYSEVYPAQTVPWTTADTGIFARHGLDVDLTYIASTQTVPAVIAGEVDIALGGGYAVINSDLAGSDLRMFMGIVNWFPYELMVTPDINGPEDLRGKKLGVSRFGSASDTATRVVLKQFGLDPDRDVVILQTGSLQERVAAMQAGAVSGGVAAPPDPTRLRRLGFKSLLDVGASSGQEMNTIAFSTARWLDANQNTAQEFVNALIEGIHFAKTHREETEQVLMQRLKLDDPEELADSYDYFITRHLERVPDPGQDATRRYLESQAATDPRAASARVEDFFDLRFIDRAKASGLVERLYGS